MRERIVVIGSILALFGGLAMWAMAADRDPELRASRGAAVPAPPIGAPAGSAEAGVERAMLEQASLGGLPVLRLFERAGEPVFGVVVPGRDAVIVRDRLRAASADRVPVVIGDGWAVALHAQASATTGDRPDAIVRRAAGFDAATWLRARREIRRPEEGAPVAEVSADPRERWLVTLDRRGEGPLGEVAIALLRAREPAEAPAWLAFGNWEGCPDPTVHVAVLRRFEQAGAEVVAIGEDRIELRASRVPADDGGWRELAREHAGYAPALLGADVRTIAALAAGRRRSRSWSFRWPRTRRVP